MAVGQAGSSGPGVMTGAGAGAAGGTEDCLVFSTAPQSPVGSQAGSQSEADGHCTFIQSPPTSPARASQVTWCTRHLHPMH